MKKNLIIRFGKIGDIISILNFAEMYNSDILSSKNKFNFLFRSSIENNDNLLKLSSRIRFGNFLLLKSIIKNYDKVFFYSQSNSIVSRCFFYVINLYFNIFYNKKIVFYFSGSQYFYNINNSSDIPIIVSKNKIKNILICYESDEPANNLNQYTINSISNFLQSKFPNVIITVLGKNFIELDSCVVNLIGKTSILELFNYIQSSDLIICCDSGPLHISAFYQKPTIAFISARQNMINWLPLVKSNYYINDHLIECSNCNAISCPKTHNICVNSDKNLTKFYDLFS